MCLDSDLFIFFFFNDTATTEIYTLSLHDALPITKLRAVGDADAIRAIGNAKAEAYRAGVESLGAPNYTLMQLTQTLADKNIRIVPDVSVTGAQGGNGLLDSMLALVAREHNEKKA